MNLHPDSLAHLEQRIGGLFDDAEPASPDPVALDDEVAMLRENGWPEMTVDTLLEWQEAYAPESVDEWREWRRSTVAAAVRDAARIPPPHNWRRWKITSRAGGWLYRLGVSGGTTYITDWSGRWVQIHRLRHKPYYLLGLRWDHWRCLLKYRHTPGPPVGFGMCAKCCPCPDCGQAAPLDHDCEAAA